MTLFRILLMAMFAALSAYTGVTIAHQGMTLFSVFFGDMGRMAWPGQFNLDFMFMLTFSALWVAWRHRFTAGGLALAVLAFFLGSSFLCVYLMVISLAARGDVRRMLVGDRP